MGRLSIRLRSLDLYKTFTPYLPGLYTAARNLLLSGYFRSIKV